MPYSPRWPRRSTGRSASPVAAPAPITLADDYPELVIEWLPDHGPNVTDGDWESMTRYLADGTVTRGRNYELDRFEAGTLSLTLRSDTRLFDPENTAGTYYGNLLPMRQIRMSAIWQGVRYPVFRGYITSWGNTAPDDVMFVTTITAKDAFARLEQIKLPSSAWALEIVRDNPSAWFRLGESDTPRVTDNSPNGNYGLYDNCQQGQQGLVVNDSNGAVSFAHSLEERIKIQNPTLLTGLPFTFSCMFQIDSSEPDEAKTILSARGGPFSLSGTAGISIVMTESHNVLGPPGGVRAGITDLGNTNYTFTGTPVRFDDERPHHLVVTVATGPVFTIYVDGENVSGTTTTNGTGNPAWPGPFDDGIFIGNVTDAPGDLPIDSGFGTDGAGFFDADLNFVRPLNKRGTLDEVCFWDDTIVAPDRIAAHALAALTGWEGDDTGARAERLLDAIDWPTDMREIETGVSVLGPASWSAGASALSVMQAWADTELGAFFIGRSGEIVWRSRHYPFLALNSLRSQATFGDGYGSETLVYSKDGFETVRDETLIRNPVTASRANGVSVTVRDDDLADNVYGDRTWASPTTEDRDDAAVRDRASWLLARYKDLQTRVASMVIKPRRDPENLWPQVLGRELGDRITANRTPLNQGSAISTDQILERVQHKFSPKSWTTTWRGSPVDLRASEDSASSYLVLDDSVRGVLDTARLAY